MSENIEQPADENPASQRHWLYGFNAFVLVLVGLVVLIFLLRICELDKVKSATKFDWTSNGANSLSGGTKKMLTTVNAKQEKYIVWSLFVDPSDQSKRDTPDTAAQQSRKREQVRDLLGQYKRASGNIEVDDRGDAAMEQIEREIRSRYADDFKPYQAAVDDFGPLVKKLSEFLKNEAAAIGANGQKPGTPAEEREAAAEVQAEFSTWPEDFAQVQKAIQRKADDILPDWGTLVAVIGSRLEDPGAMFDVLSDPKALAEIAKSQRLPQSLVAYFAANTDRYKPIAAELKAYRDKLAKLEPLKAQDVLSNLTRNTIVILGDKSAKVILEEKIYAKAPQGDRTGATGEAFVGEQALSSALYALAKPDKVSVVFVTPTSQHLLDDAYAAMKMELEDANFKVLEWSPAAEQQQGMPPQPAGPPPAIGKGVVWVVFTPDQPSMQQMMMMGGGMPDPRPVMSATKDHMDRGGQVLFMAEAGGGMMGPASFPYADLIKDFGIEVQSKFTAVHLREQTDTSTGRTNRNVMPYIGLDDPVVFTKHDITVPLIAGGMATIFGPVPQSQGGLCAVVKVLSPLPTGVSAVELVKTPYAPEYWGETDFAQDAKFDKDVDMPAALPLMAVAVKDQGKKSGDGSSDEKRIAVIGAKSLGHTFFFSQMVPVQRGNSIVADHAFPGNTELMKNTILWLSGYENMIAVSPKANGAMRIGGVSKNQLLMVRLGVILFAPLLALVVGGIVWSARRR